MDGAVREIDHSGDVGLEAEAPTFAQLLEALASGFFGLRVTRAARPMERVELRVVARGVEAAVVDWLNELVAEVDARSWAPASARVAVHPAEPDPADANADVEIRAVLEGEPLDAARHEVRFDVKAATWHGLSVTRGDDGRWRARVVFDL